jgi:hypothetical protein
MNRLSRHSHLGLTMMAVALASCSITASGTATADNPEGTSAPRAPVNYRLKEKSLIGNDLHEAGATISYAGLPAENLEPLCDEGRKRAAEYKESNAARVKQMIAAHAGTESPVGDPAKFMEAFTKALAEERAQHQAQLAAQQETMAKMLEMQQAASTQLAEAAKNMATLAAAISAQPAAPAAPETPATPPAPAADEKPTEKAAKAKG